MKYLNILNHGGHSYSHDHTGLTSPSYFSSLKFLTSFFNILFRFIKIIHIQNAKTYMIKGVNVEIVKF